MEHNLSQARECLSLLTGEENPAVTFQIFYDVDNSKQELSKTFKSTLDDALPLIKWSQERNCGVFVSINEFDGDKRADDLVTGYRGLFADCDGIAEPQWALTPHFIQKRDDTHGHAIWLVSDIKCNDEYRMLQMRVALFHGTDERVFDPARVFRVAGFNHCKNPLKLAQYAVTDDNTDGEHKYTVAEIIQAMPLNATQDAQLNAWAEKRKGGQNGTGLENSEHYNNKFMRWLDTLAPPAIDGSGNATVYQVASYGWDHGVPLETTKELMWNHYNPRCFPPWDITERSDFESPIENAYTHATSAAGCKTARAGFMALRAEHPLPEPVGGWAANAELGIKALAKAPKTTTIEEAMSGQENLTPAVSHNKPMGDRMTHSAAAIANAVATNKSPHYDLACIFDGVVYHGHHIVRCEKLFYTYNGRVWQIMSDDVIKAAILRFYKGYKPNDSLIRGIYNVFCDLVNVSHVENGIWLNGDKRDPKNMIVFKNGIIDITNREAGLQPHTSNLFVYNSCAYDYEEGAECPVFLAFLNQVFQGNQDLVRQLRHWMGYCFTSDSRYQKFAVFLGKSRAGKGVLTETIRMLIGEGNTVAPPLSNFTKDSTLNSMSKASLVLVPDAHTVSFGNRSGVQVNLKAITGGDPIDYHVLYKGTQTSIFNAKIIMSSNEVPHFDDASGAIANRMLVFPFEISFKGKEDTTLKSRISAEAKGICQWALEGLTELRANGKFVEADVALIEKEEIREDMFPLAAFVNSSCELHSQVSCTVPELFAAYKLWCAFTGVNKPMTEIQLNKIMKNSELDIKAIRPMVKGVKVRGFNGIRVSIINNG